MQRITIQFATDKTLAPSASLLRAWAKKAISTKLKAAEVTIRIVDVAEMTELNTTYRHKQGATNVLSFPFSVPDEVVLPTPILGDIVICAAVVNQEAGSQREAHWAHMVVHGVFHLFGYDHETDEEAVIMEALETEVMLALGFSNPYSREEDIKHHE